METWTYGLVEFKKTLVIAEVVFNKGKPVRAVPLGWEVASINKSLIRQIMKDISEQLSNGFILKQEKDKLKIGCM